MNHDRKYIVRRQLLGWYERHARALPWREESDPYRIWLSEIMLQQTRVRAVIEHYEKFLKRFPTLEKLAAARESSVLAAWSGLGYYRRARMLHAAARKILKQRAGEFPARAEELRKLPGIGRYTAAAIASIAFGEAVAVVDGNVKRVLERFKGKELASDELWAGAEELLDRSRPGDFNQAMMELGATVCLPRQPMCLACPLMQLCATRGDLTGAKKEIRQKKEIRYALDSRDGSVLLVQRARDSRLMPGMWELPKIAKIRSTGDSLTLRHSITSTDYVVRVVRCSVPQDAGGRWIEKRRLTALPLTGLARKILLASGII